MDEEKPPVRRLTLKPKEIVKTETVAQPGDGTAISVQLMHLQNRNAEAKPADETGTRFAPTEPRQAPIPFTPRHPAEDPEPEAPLVEESDDTISIHDMLQENRVAAAALEPEAIAMPAPRRSRRNRDFMLVLGVAAAAAGILAFLFRENREIVGLCMFIVVFMTVVLAWVMYGIMDRY
jgi:hypothetical protein